MHLGRCATNSEHRSADSCSRCVCVCVLEEKCIFRSSDLKFSFQKIGFFFCRRIFGDFEKVFSEKNDFFCVLCMHSNVY